MKKRIHAQTSDFNRYIDLYLVVEGDGRRSIGKCIELEEINEGAFCDPTIQLKKDEAQSLMDSLWECGLRPTEGSGSAGSLAATEKHLKDMRKIAGKFLGVEL